MFSIKRSWDEKSEDPPQRFPPLGDFEQGCDLSELQFLYFKPIILYFSPQNSVLQPEMVT